MADQVDLCLPDKPVDADEDQQSVVKMELTAEESAVARTNPKPKKKAAKKKLTKVKKEPGVEQTDATTHVAPPTKKRKRSDQTPTPAPKPAPTSQEK